MAGGRTLGARVRRRAGFEYRKLFPRSLAAAKYYVVSDEVSGELQFALLRREGCFPQSMVLEVGCGCLNAGVPLITYLEPGHYVGIDPNKWLREAALRRRRVRKLVAEKRPLFLSRTDFDASEAGVRFDYVLSHSVLSHCAHWQLDQFVGNVARVLHPHGRVLASIRLAEGNAFGSPGAPDKQDSMDAEWRYPGVTWFSLATVEEIAARYGLSAVLKPEYTAFYVAARPEEFHDWIVFKAA